ncbi:hypothetical protein GUITHDRAFT_65299, partial [Guillardia theta CCMP2712]
MLGEENGSAHPSFFCPMSRQVMTDPVTCCDGLTYDRPHIEAWLQDHDTSPLTNARLASRTLVPNIALRNAIEEWQQQQ